MAKRTGTDLMALAQEGATARLAEIDREMAALRRTFPGLQPAAIASPARSPKARRGRRKLSAAARKRISDAQKRRWAKQKGRAD